MTRQQAKRHALRSMAVTVNLAKVVAAMKEATRGFVFDPTREIVIERVVPVERIVLDFTITPTGVIFNDKS